MIASLSLPDPTAVLMLAQLNVDEHGRAYAGRRSALRRRQRRFQRQARLRRLLA
jgi:hypothetical protein